LFAPDRRAQSIEGGHRLLERGASGAAPFCAPLRSSKRKERAPAVERIRGSGPLGECSLEAGEGTLEIAAGREQ
jgi:hypothetical protein